MAETKKIDTMVDSVGNGEELVSERRSITKKKKNRETKDCFVGEDGEIAGSEIEKLGVFKKKSKKQSVDSEAENSEVDSKKDAKRKIMDSEAEENDLGSAIDAKKKRKEDKQSEVSEAVENDLNSTKEAKKKRKKKKTMQAEVSEAEENNNDGKDAKKKRKKKKRKQLEVSEADEYNNDGKDAKKKRKQIEVSEAEENNNDGKDAKKKRKKKKTKQTEVSEAEENNNDGKDAKKKRKKKKRKQTEVWEAEENNNNGKDAKKKRKKQESVTTPSSKSSKKVKFSDQVEIFPTEDEITEEEDEEGKVEVVRGKRFTKDEDELVEQAVLEYVDNHALGDEGINMVMDCQSHKQVKGCWKEIACALPWRTKSSVYHRAHTIFQGGSKGTWTKEELERVKEYQAKHGNDWKTLADALGKHRIHVKDAWRRTRLNINKGHWSRAEYQTLFDLVNKDLRMKAFQEKHLKHGMLRDNIPWMAISDVVGTRDHVTCCNKWYDQLLSPMVVEGIWANADDYRLLEELLKLDAACIDDVDWDNLLENRDAEACRKRWNQMVRHIGIPSSKTFAEQVEILSDRYCPDLAQDREDFDNRPYDPED